MQKRDNKGRFAKEAPHKKAHTKKAHAKKAHAKKAHPKTYVRKTAAGTHTFVRKGR